MLEGTQRAAARDASALGGPSSGHQEAMFFVERISVGLLPRSVGNGVTQGCSFDPRLPTAFTSCTTAKELPMQPTSVLSQANTPTSALFTQLALPSMARVTRIRGRSRQVSLQEQTFKGDF